MERRRARRARRADYTRVSRRPEARFRYHAGMAESGEEGPLRPEFFRRLDEGDDEAFYLPPRLVAHIDEPARQALAAHYEAVLPRGGEILDLMSSFHSHLPEGAAYAAVVGLGMNAAELAANPRLTERAIHNLNRSPSLPYADSRFDACLIAVSIQYLTRPAAVLAEVARVLKAGAPCIVTFSNRCFPTKAVAAWRALGNGGHADLVALYFRAAGGFEAPALEVLRPPGGATDPLFAVSARAADRRRPIVPCAGR